MYSNTIITAHSGADGTKDNSIEFVKYAINSNADAFEIDVRRDEKGDLYVTHDDIGKDAPRLSEVFNLAKSNASIKINCDLKHTGLERDVWHLATEYGLEGRIIFSGAIDINFLLAHREIQETVEIFLNIERYVDNLHDNLSIIPNFDVIAAEKIIKVCKTSNIDVVNINHTLLTEQFINILRENSIGVSAWTVNEENDIKHFLNQRIYNITTRNLTCALTQK